MDVLGYLGASLWRFLVGTLVFLGASLGRFLRVYSCNAILVCIYSGVSRPYPPPRAPRAPVCACTRSGTCGRTYAPTCVSFSAPWVDLGSLLYRCGFATSYRCALGFAVVRFLVRFLGFLCVSGACLFSLLHATTLASFALWCALWCAAVSILGTLLHGSLGVLTS